MKILIAIIMLAGAVPASACDYTARVWGGVLTHEQNNSTTFGSDVGELGALVCLYQYRALELGLIARHESTISKPDIGGGLDLYGVRVTIEF